MSSEFQLPAPWSGVIESLPTESSDEYGYRLDLYREGKYVCRLFLKGPYPGRAVAKQCFEEWVLIWIGQYEIEIKGKR